MLYGVDEAANLLKLSPLTIRKWLRNGKLKGTKMGKEWRVTLDDLKEVQQIEITTVRFKDIPQFTSWGSYAIDVPLYRVKETIEEYIADGLQLNPDFQRGHVWSSEQQVKYIEFLLRGGRTGRDIYFNHPGWMSSFKGDFVCVDGLQRLTAIIKFFSGEIPAFGYYISDFEDKPYNVHMRFNINNLQTRKEVLQWYIEMNEGGTIHSQEELNRVRKMIAEE